MRFSVQTVLETRKLPTSIFPCPIIEAIFDVWFDPVVPPEAIFGFFYRTFGEDFPGSDRRVGARATP
jgi:hypothetical protein